MGFILINPKDNVKVSLEDSHKYAVRDIKKGESIIKYGYPIGVASEDIKKDEHVHSHNLRTSLSGLDEYEYEPNFVYPEKEESPTVNAFIRKNGEVGIRNDVWIIPTVGCVNGIAKILAEKTGALAFTHQFGCSQLGDDLERTGKILCGLIKNPNAGGVLVLSLGCENNNISVIKSILGEYDSERIRFLNAQDSEDEIADGTEIIEKLKTICDRDKREKTCLSRIKIGLKCGGSDGLSGITANPLCGKITDFHCASGGTAILTEVPEMFGAEKILMNRCENRDIFQNTVKLINNYKQYFISHNEPISENPSPGNKAGGITTLEEKSLGCVQKGGKAVITDTLDYGDRAVKPGLNLLNGPGNDIAAVTNLASAGCQLILFTTGRGTPLGSPVPTIKISSNTSAAERKKSWIDFDAQSENEKELVELIINVCNGSPTKNEINSCREIAVFKDGVTL